MFIRFFVCFLSLLLLAGRCPALDMNVRTDDNEKLAFVNLWGKIESGDNQKFRELIMPYLKSGYPIFKVNIFSVGGDVQAAMGIADQIKTLQTRTVAPTRFADIVNGQPIERAYPSCWFTENYDTPKVVDGYNWCTCASACFLIWASGITREGNHVGIHRIYFTDENGRQFGQLMQSTPYLEEQTLARCGPDRTIHMSEANGWAETQDIQDVNCYRVHS
jgi:hypothetical protein